ncbi:MAG: SDR family NAD(P)-dependent oxidoreductase, partial [Flavobacteriales bacterium]
MQNISILGCGWLGLALGESLVKKGYFVKGSVTNKDSFEDLLQKKVQPYQLILNPQIQGDSIDDFFDSNTLIIC